MEDIKTIFPPDFHIVDFCLGDSTVKPTCKLANSIKKIARLATNYIKGIHEIPVFAAEVMNGPKVTPYPHSVPRINSIYRDINKKAVLP